MGIVLLASSCTGTPTTPTPEERTPVTGKAVFSQTITVPEDGQVVLSLRASAPGTSWQRQGAEAATVSVHVDGAYRADLVLFRGEAPYTYDALMGQMSKGGHRFDVRLEAAKSAAQARDVHVDDAVVHAYNAKSPQYLIMAHAPILYGREDVRYTDTPLLMYYEVTGGTETTTIQYTIIFSNEDGGTAADALMGRWGRLTDIEWVYRVVVDQSGKAVRGEFQDKDHNTAIFQGKTDGQQPLLKDVTQNNLFADTGASPYRFALAPALALTAGSREEVMDLHPWTYKVMAEEWEREGQSQTETTANAQTRAVSDPRNYLYVEFRSGPEPGVVCDAKLAFAVKLRGSDAWYSSDHGDDSLRIQNNTGWRRGAIELPPGAQASSVEALRFAVYAAKQQPLCSLVVRVVRKVFLLGQDYVPGPSILTWTGEQILDPDPATARPDMFAIAVGK